ncbi:MAG: MBL fold metallo-hydrolase [Candidatus Rifleibacteriota bacterium]
MRIKFWGVRGSVPVPGRETVEFGGNTTCIQLTTSDNQTIIFDAGTGIRVLGLEMMKGDFGKGHGFAHIFFTHSHWDHIQGFPFFQPAYVGKKDSNGVHIKDMCNEFVLYGAADVGGRLEATLRGQMDNYYFPVDLNYLSSRIIFKTLVDNQIQIGSTKFSAKKLIHPNGVLGYRIEDNNKIVVVATDCEHPSDGTIDQNLLELASNADVLIYDGQYTPQEYSPHKFNIEGPGKQGFGHSTPAEGVRAAKAAGVKKLVITHHDPLHNDEFLTKMEADAKVLFPNTEFAREGMEIIL